MSIKSTRRILRNQAVCILTQALFSAPNDVLANMLDVLADSGHSTDISQFDNFIVSDYIDEDDPDYSGNHV